MYPLLSPLTRAVGQMGDRAFLGVLLRCLAWAAVCFVALHIAAVWAVERIVHWPGLLGWAVALLASVGATLLAAWLFLPLAAVIGTFYIDRIAAAVERRYYPGLPPAHGASAAAQLWDGVCLGMRVLLLNLLALVLALILPGIGLLLAWAVASYAMGRGLFVMIAMRRLPRHTANTTYRAKAGTVFAYGGLMALAAYLPFINLLIPIIGTASMVHVLDLALARSRETAWR